MRKKAVRYSDELASTATLAGAGIGAAWMIPDIFFESTVEALKQGRHAGRTVGEIVVGNEGQSATRSLLEANLGSEAYYREQVNLIGNLERVYETNETLGRQVERLGVQLKGMVTEATAAGDEAANTLSLGMFRRIDNAIMNFAGDAKDAREGLDQLQEMSRVARRFYDGREKLDKTIEELMDHLGKVGLGVVRDNEAIEGDINGMIHQLGKTYEVEDNVFDLHGRTSFLKAILRQRHEELTREGIETGNAEVREYARQVNNLRGQVEQHAPIGPYRDPTAWLDYAVNPVAVGLVGAVIVKGATKMLPPSIERPLTRTLAFPAYLAKKGFEGAIYLGRMGVNTFKKFGKSKELKVRDAGDSYDK